MLYKKLKDLLVEGLSKKVVSRKSVLSPRKATTLLKNRTRYFKRRISQNLIWVTKNPDFELVILFL